MEPLNAEPYGFSSLYGRDLAGTKAVIRACLRTLAQAYFEEIQLPTIVDYAHIVGETDRPVAPANAAIVFGLQTVAGEQGQDLKLALSYESTIPTCIFYLKNFIGTPSTVAMRRCSIAAQFRNEAEIISPHKLREFHQIGYEIIGGNPAETLPVAIGTGSDLLTGLGLKHSVRISEVTILSSVQECSALRPLYDSGDRRPFESFLAQSALDTRQKAVLARLFCSRCATLLEIRELKDVLRAYDLGDILPTIERITDVLGTLPPGIRRLATLDLSLVRSARMYSGLIYQ